MGPEFNKGKTRIGRERLPIGYRAILDDARALHLVLAEMWEFARAEHHKHESRSSLIFRTVSRGERELFIWELQRRYGVDGAAMKVDVCGNIQGYWHVIDTEHVAHILNRHSDPRSEAKHGHIGIGLEDLLRLPDVINPKKIIDCVVGNDANSLRLVYSERYSDGQLFVVQEVRRSGEMLVKTLYKQK